MGFLDSLEKLLSGNKQNAPAKSGTAFQGVKQAPQQILGNNTPQAHAYNNYLKQPEGQQVGVPQGDPANFGYPAENPRLQVNRFVNSGLPQAPNLGVNSYPVQGGGLMPLNAMQQGGQFNPGYTPLQRQGGGGLAVQRPMVNPQVRDDGYFWNN